MTDLVGASPPQKSSKLDPGETSVEIIATLNINTSVWSSMNDFLWSCMSQGTRAVSFASVLQQALVQAELTRDSHTWGIPGGSLCYAAVELEESSCC